MTFEEKYAFARQELIQRKIWNENTKPRIMLLLLKLGIRVPPLFYTSFFVNFLIFGIYFSVSWGIFMYLWLSFFMKDTDVGPLIFMPSIYAGIMFGILVGTILKYGAYKLKLTPWEKITK